MKGIFKDVIEKGGYKLPDMLSKITKCYVEGTLSEDEKNELELLARNNARTEYDLNIEKKLEEMDKRIKALENREPTSSDEEYPAFVEGKWYYAGDKCSEKGVNYICVAPEGVVCVWSPSVYPSYWKIAK